MLDDPARRWQHPWLRIEPAIRVILADPFTRGATDTTDAALDAGLIGPTAP